MALAILVLALLMSTQAQDVSYEPENSTLIGTENFSATTEAASFTVAAVKKEHWWTHHMDLVNGLETYTKYHFTVTILAGFITNGLSIFVFASKGQKEATMNNILIALAVSDMLSLSNNLDFSIFLWSDYKYSFMQFTNVGCKLTIYLANSARDWSSYLILLFTVDRFIAVWFPMKRSVIMTKRRVNIAIGLILVMGLLMESYLPFIMVRIDTSRCHSKDLTLMKRCTTALRNTMGFIVPGVVVAIINTLIVSRLKKYEVQRASLMEGKTATGFNASQKVESQAQSHSLTIMLVTVSTVSFLAYLPKVTIFIYLLDAPLTLEAYVALAVGDCLATLNFTCNFFFYCLSGKQFRKDLVDAFSKLMRRQPRECLLTVNSLFSAVLQQNCKICLTAVLIMTEV